MFEKMIVAVVGVCASGKTTLVKRLKELGVEAYNVAQEHSGIKELWRRKKPDILIMLDVSMAVVRQRRDVPWGEERLVLQRERLKNARANADLYIQTDTLAAAEVAQLVWEYIKRRRDSSGSDYSTNACSRS